MSNDTTVHVTLSSRDRLMVLAAVAYLRNKDRGWDDVNVEEVKRFTGQEYYGARLYGWANENAWNYHITGDSGEMADLASKFHGLEINGYYNDSYGGGALYSGIEKSYEADRNRTCLYVVMASLEQAGDPFNNSTVQALCEHLATVFSAENGGSSSPPFTMDLDIGDKGDDAEAEAEKCCAYLRSLNAPEDFIVKGVGYMDGEDVFEMKVWGDRYLPSEQVGARDVEAFLEGVVAITGRIPEDIIDKLPDLQATDLAVLDENNGTVLHLAAELGLLDQVPAEFLTLDHLLKENYHDQTPISLAIESGNLEQLPEAYRDENFSRNNERQQYFEQLIENGQESLAIEIARSFPNPFMQEKLDRMENLQQVVRLVVEGEGARALETLRESVDTTLCEDLLEAFSMDWDGNPQLSQGFESEDETALRKFFSDFLDLCGELIPDETASFCAYVDGFTLQPETTAKDLSSIRRFTSLEWLDASGCEKLDDFDFLEWFPQLTRLAMSELPSLSDLTPLGKLTQLTELNLSGCPSLENLAPLSKLKNLTELNLSYCASVNDITPLKGITGLNDLNLCDCKLIGDLTPLAELTNMTVLNLWGCASVEDLTPLKDLTGLTNLALSHCPVANDLTPLRGLKNLQRLNLAGLIKIENLDALTELTSLYHLDLERCSSLADISALASFSNLSELDLGSCSSLSDLSPLSGKESLTSLILSGCSAFTDFKLIASLPSLSNLELAELPSLEDLSP
ncbi:MAG: leucine-rich repeat domain-containing protein, partial [Opitutales bacterium]